METRVLTTSSSTNASSHYEAPSMVNRKEVHHHHQSSGMHHHQQHRNRAPPLRPHSTPATLLWLEENYEMAQGVCVPRNTLYLHYVDFCSKHGMTPVNAASFGKIIRQQFPQLTTRRLGTRGQSRYHYYGIAIRESSPYYELVYSKKGLQASEDMRKDHIRQQMPPSSTMSNPMMPRTSSSSSSAGAATAAASSASSSSAALLATRLPEFPNLRDLCLPPGGSGGVPEERVSTFIVMYRAHCQRLLDTIIRGSFQEVETFLLHYWQGMPPHLVGVLGSHVVVNIVGVCDSILYRSVCSILMSSVIRGLPENLIQMIRKFASELDSWLRAALEELPENLKAVKLDLARHFCHMLRRQSSLNQLFGTIRLALHDSQVSGILLHDWQRQNIHSLAKSAIQAAANFINNHGPDETFRKRRPDLNANPHTVEFVASFGAEFERLLAEQAPLEHYTEWIESIVDRCILQQRHHHHHRASGNRSGSLRYSIRQFLLIWMAFSGRLLRDLTTQTAPGFETFHLIRIMIDDYFLYLVELLHIDDRAGELMRNITLDVPPQYFDTDYEGFLATVFASLDVSTIPELPVNHHHSSPHDHGTGNDSQYSIAQEESSSMESSPINHQQIASGEQYLLPTPVGEPTVSTDETFNYDYSNLRLPNGYKFNGSNASGGGYSTNYPPVNTAPSTHQLTGYYQNGTGFSNTADVPADYNGSTYNSYQQYLRRDFVEPTTGFYPAEQSPLLPGNQSAAYIASSAGADYYNNTVYEVASSSSNSSASVYGDLNDQSHLKLKKNSNATTVITQQQSASIQQAEPTECAKTSENNSTTTSFHIASESYIRS